MTLSSTFRRILGLLKPHAGRMIIALLAMIVTAATEPAVASMMKLLLDTGFSETRDFSLWMVPLFVVGIFVVRGLSTFTTSYLMSSVSGALMSTLRQQIFSRLLDVPLSYYRDNSTGKLISATSSFTVTAPAASAAAPAAPKTGTAGLASDGAMSGVALLGVLAALGLVAGARFATEIGRAHV